MFNDKVYEVLDICDYIIRKQNDLDRPINPLRLHPYIYFTKALFISLKNRKLFQEEMYAVDFGAIVPEVYYAFDGYSAMDIIVSNNKYRLGNPLFGDPVTSPSKIIKSDAVLIDQLLECLKRYSTSSLTNMIFNQDPWKDAHLWRRRPDDIMFCSSAKISDRAFRDYFRRKGNENLS